MIPRRRHTTLVPRQLSCAAGAIAAEHSAAIAASDRVLDAPAPRGAVAVIRARKQSSHNSPHIASPDAVLVQACLDGDPEGWEALVGKYKRLIYSIPIRFGAQPDDAADIFQAVCADLVAELPRLRRHDAVRPWLMRVTRHKTLHWKARARREAGWRQPEDVEQELALTDGAGAKILEDVERAQALREAVAKLPDRCRALVQMLFYQQPPLPYDELARRLGLATGSIGFIRGRCLKKLRAHLKSLGF